MELYIIRHAQSVNNALPDQTDRLCDPPLTELGRRQTEILAQHLATETGLSPRPDESGGYGITRLYCSPMWRALQTAGPVGRALGIAPEVWIDVHEHGGVYLDHGEDGGIVGYPGKARPEILAEFPDFVLPDAITEQGWWHQGREERASCFARAIRAARRLRGWATGDERIAIITHGGFIDALMKALFSQLPDCRRMQPIRVYYHHLNTAISRVDIRSTGYLDLRYFNRVDHIPRELVS
jgi:2,3-bisphosphoglycerate-dependent phosphoglycerate mutase